MFTSLRMNSNNLSIIHPDTIECVPSPVSNMPFDELMDLRDSDYKNEKGDWDDCLKTDFEIEIEEHALLEREDNDAYKLEFQESIKNLYPPSPPTQEPIDPDIIEKLTGNYHRKIYEVKNKIGDGEMEYIKDPNTREMCTNAWKAITFSNNWDFVAQDIETFMLSNDPRIDEISRKMEEFGYNGHSGCSFGFTMRYMQLLVQKGEEEFKKCFE